MGKWILLKSANPTKITFAVRDLVYVTTDLPSINLLTHITSIFR